MRGPDAVRNRLAVSGLVRLVQSGVFVPLERPCSVHAFLCGTLGLSDGFIFSRVQTVLLNSKVVDDMDGAWLVSESRLALSAAMPGVVGAALRRGGLLARLREGIRCPSVEKSEDAAPFWLELRLYNTMIEALASPLLTCGFAARRDRVPASLLPLLRPSILPLPSSDFCFIGLPRVETASFRRKA